MKKWIKYLVLVLAIVLFVISGKYAFSYIYNEWITKEYDSGNYDLDTEPLFFVNCFEPCIAYYNNGNILYQQKDYNGAIGEYQQALGYDLSHGKECDVRVNLALAMIYNMGDDYASPEKIESSIETLKEAREVLLAEGCATDNDDGHDKEAQKLKNEIDELIKQLEEQQQQQSQQPQQGEEEGGQSSEDQYEEDIKEQLQENQANAHQEREDNLEEYETDYNDWNYDYDGIW